MVPVKQFHCYLRILLISLASSSEKTGTALDLCIVATPFIFSPVYEFWDFLVQGIKPVSMETHRGVSLPAGTFGIGIDLITTLELVLLQIRGILEIDFIEKDLCHRFLSISAKRKI
jgi:hypothetical protein